MEIRKLLAEARSVNCAKKILAKHLSRFDTFEEKRCFFDEIFKLDIGQDSDENLVAKYAVFLQEWCIWLSRNADCAA